jgi:putative SOS response-associated peptidase YedK
MCFHAKQSKTAAQLKNRFKVRFDKEIEYEPSEVLNGFTYPKLPVITNKDASNIQLFNWGLIPSWAKDVSIRKNTMNARMETIAEKPSFRNSVRNRCLVLVDGFYEWQWLDEKGKKKQKYELTMQDNEAFAMAGLWNEWVDKETGEVVPTFTILTTEADELMAHIHNSKKRMPVILSANEEMQWLKGADIRVHVLLEYKIV